MEAYKQWIRRNYAWVSQLESALQGVTWLLPDRFAGSEVTLELVSTLVGMFGVVNDTIMNESASQQESERRPRGLPWPLLVGLTQQTEVLGEMAAEHLYGPKNKWGVISSIEAIKTVLRLIILYNNRGRVLIEGGTTVNKATSGAPQSMPSPSRTPRVSGNDISDPTAAALRALAEFRAKKAAAAKQHIASRTVVASSSAKAADWDGFWYAGPASHLDVVPEKDTVLQTAEDRPNPLQSWWAHATLSRQERAPQCSNPSHHHRHSQRHGGVSHSALARPFNPTQGQSLHSSAHTMAQDRAVSAAHRLDRVDTRPREKKEQQDEASTSEAADVDLEAGRAIATQVASSRHILSAARTARRLVLAGEVLHIVRPLVYALAIRRYGLRSWKPWLLSMAFNAASDAALARADILTACQAVATNQSRDGTNLALDTSQDVYVEGNGPGAMGAFVEQEREELARRRAMWIFYLLRSPCFDVCTKPSAEALLRTIGSIPLLGTLAGKGYELLLGIQGYYFYTAAS
eukprot:jgi/Chlat1/8946/Chrsp94S08252